MTSTATYHQIDEPRSVGASAGSHALALTFSSGWRVPARSIQKGTQLLAQYHGRRSPIAAVLKEVCASNVQRAVEGNPAVGTRSWMPRGVVVNEREIYYSGGQLNTHQLQAYTNLAHDTVQAGQHSRLLLTPTAGGQWYPQDATTVPCRCLKNLPTTPRAVPSSTRILVGFDVVMHHRLGLSVCADR